MLYDVQPLSLSNLQSQVRESCPPCQSTTYWGFKVQFTASLIRLQEGARVKSWLFLLLRPTLCLGWELRIGYCEGLLKKKKKNYFGVLDFLFIYFTSSYKTKVALVCLYIYIYMYLCTLPIMQNVLDHTFRIWPFYIIRSERLCRHTVSIKTNCRLFLPFHYIKI